MPEHGSTTPLTVLNEAKNRMVEVHTSVSDVYTGVLHGFDMYVNISLKDAEVVEFETKEKVFAGDTIVQGNFVTFVKLI